MSYVLAYDVTQVEQRPANAEIAKRRAARREWEAAHPNVPPWWTRAHNIL